MSRPARLLMAIAACAPTLARANDVSGVVVFARLSAACVVGLALTYFAWIVLGRLRNLTARAYLRMLVLTVFWTPVPFLNHAWDLPVLPSCAFIVLLSGLPASDTLMIATCVGITAVLGATALLIRTLWHTRRMAARS